MEHIDDEFGTESPQELDEFAVENAAMEAFIQERVERYVAGSRENLLQEVAAFAKGEGSPNILVISGPPGSGKSALLLQSGDISLPEPPPSVHPWTDEEIHATSDRIRNRPARLDRIIVFAQFVNSEAHYLNGYASHSMFTIQHAYNYAEAGPVAQAAIKILKADNIALTLLLPNTFIFPYNPHPACLQTFVGHRGTINSISLTPNGHLAISASSDKTLRVWEVETGRCLLTLRGHQETVTTVTLTPDGLRAVSGSEDRTLTVWEVDTGRCLRIIKGHESMITGVGLTPDGRLAVSTSADNTLQVWDVKTGRCLRIIEGPVGPIFSYLIMSKGLMPNPAKWITAISLTPDGCLAISVCADNTLRVWNVDIGECIRIIKTRSSISSIVAATPDTRLGIVEDEEFTLIVLDMGTGFYLRTLLGHTHTIKDVDLTPDGLLAISSSLDRTLRLWEMKTGRCLGSLKTSDVGALSITFDGSHAISGGSCGFVKFWNIEKAFQDEAMRTYTEDEVINNYDVVAPRMVH